MNSIPLLCGGLTIGLLMIYQNTHFHPAAGGEILKTHFSFDPIVWKAFQPNSLVLATIFSYLFPLAFFLFNINKTYKDSNLLFVWCNALVAILIFSFVYLVPGTYVGDMGWQVIPASYLLFCTSSFLFFSNFKWNIKNILLLIFFSTHVLCGIYYIYRISGGLGYA